jgi:hypothetical protein
MFKSRLRVAIGVAALIFSTYSSAEDVKVKKDKPSSSTPTSSQGVSVSSGTTANVSSGSSQGVSVSSGTTSGFSSPTFDALKANPQTGQPTGTGASSSSHEYDGAPRRK